MRIGVDGNEANVKYRVGAGQYAFEILKRLYSLDQKNQYLIYLKDNPLSDFPKERENWRYLFFGAKKLWTQISLPVKLFFGPKLDLFFTPTHYAPRFSPVPRVITIFDLSYLYFPELFRKSDLYQLKNWTAYSVAKAKVIITISEFTKKEIVKNYGFPKDKIFVCYPGFDRSQFRSQGKDRVEKVKIKYGISGDYLFYLGTIQPRKNLIRLLEAVKGLKEIKLVIAGKKGWLYDEFFQKVAEMKDRVIVTDFVPDEDLPALFSGAKAFVLPSLYEGFGIPVIEAMACGCPVVVSNVSSLPEVVDDAGVLVNPNSIESIKEGIDKVLKGENFAQELSQKGLKTAQKFSWEKCAKEVLKVLESVGA